MKDNQLANYLFHQGTNFHAYEYLGCTVQKDEHGYLYTFRTWAPSAVSVGLISSFSGWDTPIDMSRVDGSGIYEATYFSAHSLEYEAYKFRITSSFGTHDKGDPYARFSRGGSDGASLIYCESDFDWSDDAYINYRKETVCVKDSSYLAAPINIYEVHLGSFMRHDDGTPLSYRELADILPYYAKRLGYTHVEFLPLQEHPYDGSWGYQVCAFYAPTSRFGTPDDFKFLINALHTAGVGVIMDWVPAHFPKDEWGLYEFDGSPLYEYQGKDRQESSSWGTRFFDLGREQIQSFLVSNALYFFREFHIDGLRVDAVASMIYLDYDRLPGEWIPNVNGGRENLEAIAFIKKLNSAVFSEFPQALMIAEESTAFGGITHPISEGGLGFNLKWNMGFANDFYDYVSTDPVFRKYKHTALNFPIMYAFSENYCMPISHDEVVHGKKSFIDKMHGSYEDKFLMARLGLMMYMTYPGKKLLFMGTEFAQFREWNYDDSLEWFMLDYDTHRAFRDYVIELNAFYLKTAPLWEIDFSARGFEWILADEAEKNLVAFRRRSLSGESVTVVLNFSGAEQAIKFPINQNHALKVVFDTGNFSASAENLNVTKKDNESFASLIVPRFCGIILKEFNDKKIIIKNKKLRRD